MNIRLDGSVNEEVAEAGRSAMEIAIVIPTLNEGEAVGRLPTVMLSVLLMIGAMRFFTIGLVADLIKRLRRRK